MNRVIVCSILDRRELAILTRLAGFLALGTLLAVAVQPPAHAITINMEYTDEGDPVPHDENPAWDPAGVILKAHFQTAKVIWESLLTWEEEYSFDFHWDDDIGDDKLGLYTPGIDEFIELNSTKNWFADPTPNDSVEFNLSPTFASDLTLAQQTDWFPGAYAPWPLEVGYTGGGDSSPSLHPGFLADNGFDLLSVVLHEIGHALGINLFEGGEFDIYPQHVGLLESLMVAEDPEGGHLVGGSDAFWLMGKSLPPGERRLPSATDVLVIAYDQGYLDVHLARVARITSGDWSEGIAWIGGLPPDATQDAYVTQGGTVYLDVEANVRSLTVNGGSTVDVQTTDLNSAGDINYDGGSLAVGIGGSIIAKKISGDPASLTTTAFSRVRFNEFTRGTSSAALVSFNGSVGIGVGTPALIPVTFNPSNLANWNVAQNLTVGDQRNVNLIIDNGAWNVGGNLVIRGFRDAFASYPTAVTVESSGSLSVTGVVEIGTNGELEYKNSTLVSNTTYEVRGGSVSVVTPPPPSSPYLDGTAAGRLTFDGTVSAGSATINAEGGLGEGGPGAFVTFRDQSRTSNTEFWTKAGRKGPSLFFNHNERSGIGGRVQFEDHSFALDAHFRNDGADFIGNSGSGGATYFVEDSYASNAVFDNYGSPTSWNGQAPLPGGRTEFFDDSSAWTAEFNNHPGLGMDALGAGITVFHGNSTADGGTFNNKGGVPGLPNGGATEFYDQATAENATFINERGTGLAQNPATAGQTRFYGSSTAGTATFHNKGGGGTTIFFDSSTAGDGTFLIEDGGPGVFGGNVVFTGNSKGGTASLTIKPQSFSATIQFGLPGNLTHAPDAEQAEIILENGSSAGLTFTNSSTMGHANIDIGFQSGLSVRELATAGNATIRLRPGSSATFTGINNPGNFPTATGGNAVFNIDGGSVSGGNGGALFFSGLSTAGDATINIGGGTVSGAGGAQVHFGSGANAGTATVIAGSGVAGAGGGGINLGGGTIASNARFTVGAGGFVSLPSGGPIEVGSIEGAGTIQLGHNELRAGALNTSTTISGPIIGFATNPRLTKIGTGTLTLTGANTYIGLTKVDGGTLVINGSTPGSVEVNDGAALKGIGTIGGTVTVNGGGTLSPGLSPGMISIGALAMTSGGMINAELGPSTYDRIVASGNASLAGILNVSLVDGFTPAAGNTFNILDWGSVTGSFSSLNLVPLTSGLSWDTSQLYTTGVLSVAAAPGLSGDYNNDGAVDAADYVVWRKTGGPPADYNTWRTNFGQSTGSGGDATVDAADSGVPEPTAPSLLFVAAVAFSLARPRRSALEIATRNQQRGFAFAADPANGQPAKNFYNPLDGSARRTGRSL